MLCQRKASLPLSACTEAASLLRRSRRPELAAPEIPEGPEAPEAPKVPEVPEVSKAPEVPEVCGSLSRLTCLCERRQRSAVFPPVIAAVGPARPGAVMAVSVTRGSLTSDDQTRPGCQLTSAAAARHGLGTADTKYTGD